MRKNFTTCRLASVVGMDPEERRGEERKGDETRGKGSGKAGR
jgi:hypothetical protein